MVPKVEIRLTTLLIAILFIACEEKKEHTAPAIHERDSVAMMTTYGVNTLISDSGVIKYRIVTERWEINQNKKPSKWIFERGLFLEQFDQDFKIQSHIQCDTAYYYDQQRLWELRGNVDVKTKQQLHFTSQELFWDELAHELYSNKYSKLVTPERTLQGAYFRSDDQMTKYRVSNTKGSFEKGNFGEKNNSQTTANSTDSTMPFVRQAAVPRPKTQNPNSKK